MSAGVLTVISLSVSILLLITFSVEQRRHVRFAARVRDALDRALEERSARVRARMPSVNRAFFGHIFHYLVHLVLTQLLSIVAFLERGLKLVARLNRKKAQEKRERTVGGDSHLRAIAEHKEETALSPAEKEAHKEAAIEGRSAPQRQLRKKPKK